LPEQQIISPGQNRANKIIWPEQSEYLHAATISRIVAPGQNLANICSRPLDSQQQAALSQKKANICTLSEQSEKFATAHKTAPGHTIAHIILHLAKTY
jgi:hypothetical protein